jgi:hypothetical protein
VELVGELRASTARDDSWNVSGRSECVRVGHRGEGTNKSGIAIRTGAKVVASSVGITAVGAVQGVGASTAPNVVLNQELSTDTSVDTVVHVDVVVAVDAVGGDGVRSSSERYKTRATYWPVPKRKEGPRELRFFQ